MFQTYAPLCALFAISLLLCSNQTGYAQIETDGVSGLSTVGALSNESAYRALHSSGASRVVSKVVHPFGVASHDEPSGASPPLYRYTAPAYVGGVTGSTRTGTDSFTQENAYIKLFYSYQDPPATGPVSMPILVALYVLLMDSFAMRFPTSAAFRASTHATLDARLELSKVSLSHALV